MRQITIENKRLPVVFLIVFLPKIHYLQNDLNTMYKLGGGGAYRNLHIVDQSKTYKIHNFGAQFMKHVSPAQNIVL